MRTLSWLRSLWRNLAHRERMERDIDDEIRGTLAALEEEHRQGGLAPAEARRVAMLQLGRVESLKEQVHDAKAGAFAAGFVQDLRHTLRLIRRGPLFAGFAISSLTLGIGATGAIFMLFDAIALRTLDVPAADRLVLASLASPTRSNYSMPYPQFEAIRQRTTTLDSIFATTPFGRVTVAAGDAADIADGMYVTGDYYRTLRLTPALGRLIDAEDDRTGQRAAVLNHGYWQRRFGGRPDIIGSAITLNRVAFTVIGVEPPGFNGTEVGRPYDVSVPLQAYPALNEGRPILTGVFTTWLYQMGRLKPGVTLEAAQQEATAIFKQVSLDGARTAADQRLARESWVRFEPGAHGNSSELRNRYARWLQMLLILLGAVLLLASLNVATLLLSRADARQHEFATRLALGAGRWRIVRQLVAESMVLAAIAAVGGLVIATWGSRALLSVAFPAAERTALDLAPGLRLIAFTIGVSALTCLLFGLLPALRATKATRLTAARQIGAGPRRRALDRALVAAQVALSLVLLVTAGLFVRTLQNLWGQEPGYDRRNIVMFSTDARLAGRTGDEIPHTYGRILTALGAVPGAQSVTMSAVRPVSENYYFITSFANAGERRLPPEQRIRAALNHAAPGYFATLGIRLITGRDFDERDTRESPRVAIISEHMARHFAGNPVGQRIDEGPSAREIVGVAADARYARVKDPVRDVIYFPVFQMAPRDLGYSPTFEIRHAGSSADLIAGVRQAVAGVDPLLPLFRVTTLERQTSDSFARERLLAIVTSYIGAFAALLSCIGLYGLVSYGVTRRTAEMGLRMALGAPPAAVRWLVIREDAWTIAAGIVTGVAAAAATVRLLRSMLFGVEPFDPGTVAAATAILLLMAFAAAYLPARRAARIDPLLALRHD